MKNFQQLRIKTGLIALLLLFVQQVSAGPNVPFPPGSPVWCWGASSLDTGQCVLYLGTEQTCKNLEPCLFSSVASGGVIPDDPIFCKRLSSDTSDTSDTKECELFLGDVNNSCPDTDLCPTRDGELPRILKKPQGGDGGRG